MPARKSIIPYVESSLRTRYMVRKISSRLYAAQHTSCILYYNFVIILDIYALVLNLQPFYLSYFKFQVISAFKLGLGRILFG